MGNARDPKDVELYISPWVQGTRAAAYHGPIATELFVDDWYVDDRADAWGKAVRNIMHRIRVKAAALGANAVIGIELTCDPFAEHKGRSGLRLHLVGTAASLEPLF